MDKHLQDRYLTGTPYILLGQLLRERGEALRDMLAMVNVRDEKYSTALFEAAHSIEVLLAVSDFSVRHLLGIEITEDVRKKMNEVGVEYIERSQAYSPMRGRGFSTEEIMALQALVKSTSNSEEG